MDDDQDFYLTITIDRVSKEMASNIMAEIVSLRGTVVGMSIHYGEPI